MSRAPKLILISHDAGLIEHWQRAFGKNSQIVLDRLDCLQQITMTNSAQVWIDLSLPDVPPWNHATWSHLFKINPGRIVAASSNPKDNDAVIALDAGCAAYCHAFSDVATLKQIRQVVEAGHVWIGKTLMDRLLRGVNHAVALAPGPVDEWDQGLTTREREVAILAANAASNHHIALDCDISERTVKAHLSAVFKKLNITDRLQLALRVHGIN